MRHARLNAVSPAGCKPVEVRSRIQEVALKLPDGDAPLFSIRFYEAGIHDLTDPVE
jgi:hypothetical protein